MNKKDILSNIIIKVFYYIFISFLLFGLMIFTLGYHGNIIKKILINIDLLLLLYTTTKMYLSAYNRIIIDNDKTTKINWYGNRTDLGNLSDITSYAIGKDFVHILKDNKELFSLPSSSDQAKELLAVLEKEKEKVVFIGHNIYLEFIYSIFSYIMLFCTLLTTSKINLFGLIIPLQIPLAFFYLYILSKGLKDKYKIVIIKNNETYIKNLFGERVIDNKNITKITYKEIKTGGRYKSLSDDFIITGYINNNKIFVKNNISSNMIKMIKEIYKKNNIKVKKIH